jgi:hypothetical protein
MSIRPVHTWWLGLVLFAPSIFIWAFVLVVSLFKGVWHCPFDWYGIKQVYLPLFAAILCFTTPLVCMRLLQSASWRRTAWVFLGYVALWLTWAVIDIRLSHYQMSGEDFHGYYWHSYYTWYFMPYKWIE